MRNVIEAIEEKLQAQKDDIFFKKIQIDDLKKQLEKANAERDKALAELAEIKGARE